MTEPIVVAPDPKAAAPVVETPVVAPDAAEPVVEKTILDNAVDAEQVAENKRLMEADPKDLNDEEKTQRESLLAAEKERLAKTVPEKYEVKLPDGVNTGALLDKLTPVFKEMGLTGAQVQKLADVYGPHFKEQGEAAKKAFIDGQEANFKAFIESEKKTTFEKLGAGAEKELAFAAKSRDRFLSPQTIELLNASGIANNISLISDLIKIGKMISEDKLAHGKGVPGDTKSDGEVLYGDTHKEK